VGGVLVGAVSVAFAVAVALGWARLTLMVARLMSPASGASGR